MWAFRLRNRQEPAYAMAMASSLTLEGLALRGSSHNRAADALNRYSTPLRFRILRDRAIENRPVDRVQTIDHRQYCDCTP